VAVFDDSNAPTLAFLKSLGARHIPVYVYGHGFGSAARWSRYCKEYRRSPPVEDPTRFLPWLRDKIRGGEIARVAPTTDLIAYYLAVLRDEFSPAVQRTIPPLTEIEHCLIKTQFASRCAFTGHSAPQSEEATDIESALAAADRLGYPLMLKPKSHLGVGMAERGCVVNSAEELRARFQPYAGSAAQAPLFARYPELRWPMLQQFLPAATRRVFSVSGIKDADHGVLAATVSYKAEQWPPKVGVSARQVSAHDRRVLREGLALVDSLLTCGIFELELVTQDKQLLAIDLNPRGFGFMALDMARGNDLPWLWYQTTLRPVHVQSLTPPTRINMECRFALPFYISRLVEIVKGPHRYRALRRMWSELRQPSVSMAGHWRDPAPMLLAALSMLRHPGSLIRPFWREIDAREQTTPTSTSLARIPRASSALVRGAPGSLVRVACDKHSSTAR
jgi:predicted ATP-grasp superfamily ATP-dependent carboligase